MKDLVLRIYWWFNQMITGEVRSDRGKVGNLRDRNQWWHKILGFTLLAVAAIAVFFVIRAIISWFFALDPQIQENTLRYLMAISLMGLVYTIGFIQGRKSR